MKTPAKYQPTPRKIDDKDWMYEQYWGNLRSAQEIAAMDEVNVGSDLIYRKLREHGIPAHTDGYNLEHTRTTPIDGYRPADDDEDTTVDWSKQ